MNQLYLGILSWSWGIFTMLNNNGVLCILELFDVFSWWNTMLNNNGVLCILELFDVFSWTSQTASSCRNMHMVKYITATITGPEAVVCTLCSISYIIYNYSLPHSCQLSQTSGTGLDLLHIHCLAVELYSFYCLSLRRFTSYLYTMQTLLK